MQNEIIEQLQEKLAEYITEHLKLEMNSSGFFSCPTGKHRDSDPSCHVMPYPNKHLWHCFGCNSSGNIFHLAHYKEGKAINGPEFWVDTLVHLAKVFDLPYEPEELDQATKEKMQKYRAYKDAASILCTYPDDPEASINRFLKERNWKVETAKLLMVGAVDSFEDYVKSMEARGWAKEYLSQIDLLNKNIFSKNRLIFVVTDEKNRPVGFAARDMKWKKKGDGPKFVNSLSSDIYKKGGLLYNFYNAKQNTPPLWIVEGYGDAVRMHECGIPNTAALGSTALCDTEDGSHIELLQRNNISKIVLAFDGDESGRLATSRALELLCKYRQFNVKIVLFPEGYEPDNFLPEKGAEELAKLSQITPFEFQLTRYPNDYDPTILCQEMILFIHSEKDNFTRDRMAKALSERTGVTEDVIWREIDLRDNNQMWENQQKFIDIRERLVKDVQRAKNINELSYRLEKTNAEVIEIVDVTNSQAPDADRYKKRLEDLKTQFEDQEQPTFKCGRFQILQHNTDGIPKGASMIGLAGISNIGKTSFVRALTLELVENNDDIVCLIMSIDDPFQKVVPGYISLMTGLDISEVRRAKMKIWNDEAKKSRFIWGWQRMMKYADSIIIKDIVDGGTTASLEKNIKYYQELYKDKGKKLFCVIDNFHKLRDFPTIQGTQRYSAISSRVKDISTTYDVSIFNVMELRKSASFGDRPVLQDLKESIDIEYDCDMIFLMHQDFHLKKEGTDMVWNARLDNGVVQKMPYNELIVAKNKESGYKGSLYYRFRTDRSQFIEVSEDTMNMQIASPELVISDPIEIPDLKTKQDTRANRTIIDAEIVPKKLVLPPAATAEKTVETHTENTSQPAITDW